jgi:NAD(P)-dependent dehydrogenase (short-subunit alcohol dehydrogenase family)
MQSEQVALVTGASSGIGRATAQLLAQRGFRVFGTSRQPEPDPTLEYAMLPLDVRSEESVRAAVQAVLDQAGRIDVLVNNAGYGQFGAVEENTIAEAQAQFDTNVFGALRVIQAVVPIMRRQGSGRIISTSSVLGQVAPPFVGLYAGSKFALEGLSESLRAELRPFGIHVSLVEPGFVKSSFVDKEPTHPIAAYDSQRHAATAFNRQGLANGLDPNEVAGLIVRVATRRKPGLRYRAGRSSSLLIMLKRLLPEALFELVTRRIFQPSTSALANTTMSPNAA